MAVARHWKAACPHLLCLEEKLSIRPVGLGKGGMVVCFLSLRSPVSLLHTKTSLTSSVMGISHFGFWLVIWEMMYMVPRDLAMCPNGPRWKAPVLLPGTIWAGGLAPLPITVNIPGLLMCENEWIFWTSFPGCELEEEEALMPFGEGRERVYQPQLAHTLPSPNWMCFVCIWEGTLTVCQCGGGCL